MCRASTGDGWQPHRKFLAPSRSTCKILRAAPEPEGRCQGGDPHPLSTRLGRHAATIPLFYFDEQRALWVKEGSATLKPGEWRMGVCEGRCPTSPTGTPDRYQETVYPEWARGDEAGAPVGQAAGPGGRRHDYWALGVDHRRPGEFSIALRKDSPALLPDRRGQRALAEGWPYSTDTTVRSVLRAEESRRQRAGHPGLCRRRCGAGTSPCCWSVLQALGVGWLPVVPQWRGHSGVRPRQRFAAAVFRLRRGGRVHGEGQQCLGQPDLAWPDGHADNREPLLVSQPARRHRAPQAQRLHRASASVERLAVQWQRNGVTSPAPPRSAPDRSCDRATATRCYGGRHERQR